MKNIIISSALIILSSTYLSKAQVTIAESRDRIVFGAKAGINNSNVYDEKGDEFKADAKIGFAGGVFVGIPIGKFIGLQPEVLVSQKGYQATGKLFGTPYSNTRTTTYLDVPLQFQIKPIEYITLLAGVQYSYLLNQTDKFEFGSNSAIQEQEFKNDNPRNNIFGAVVGFDINVGHFVLSAKGCWDLQNNAEDGTSTTPRYKNVWLQATVGFRIY